MRNLFLLVLLFPSLSFALNLEVGDSRFYKASSSAKVKLKPAQLVEVKEVAEGLMIKAKSPGRFSLTIDDKTHSIFIIPKGATHFYHKLKAISQTMLGPEVKFISGQVQVHGKIHRLSDWSQLTSAAQEGGSHFLLKAHIDTDLRAGFRHKVKEALGSVGVTSFHLSYDPHPSLELPNEYQDQGVDKVIQAMGLAYRFSSDQISVKPLVEIQIIVAEVTQSFQSDIGIEWPSQMTAEIKNQFRSHEELLATLKLAEAEGRGQVLASPRVVAKSGGHADFWAGGELPIRIVTRFSKSIEWKRHGISLKIKPKADHDQNISLELEAEVSMPDSGYSVDNIPAMKTNRVTSQFDIKAQTTIMLSGLIQNLESFNQQSLAGLSKLPIIGSFFRSRSRRQNKTELVIFVTPTIRKNNKAISAEAPKSWEGKFEYR